HPENSRRSLGSRLRGEFDGAPVAPLWAESPATLGKHLRSESVLPLNLPNVLTLLRVLAVPVIVVALLDETPNGDALAAGVFALAALTDGLDGYIARRRRDVTTFGKLMDPLADKVLIIAALVSLVSLGRLAAWVAMVIIARELAVTALRTIAAEQGVVLAA